LLLASPPNGALARLKRRGFLAAHVDPTRTAIAALALLEGVIALWLFDPGLFSLKTQAERLVDDFLKGIKK